MSKSIRLFAGVTMNAMVCSGAPCVAGRRIRTQDINTMFQGGVSIEDLSDEYDLHIIQVEDALRYEYTLAKGRIRRPRAENPVASKTKRKKK